MTSPDAHHRDPTDWTAIIGFWCRELDHRADDPAAVRAAAGVLTDAGTGSGRGGHDVGGNRLAGLDPLRERPLLDDDPDGAVLVDILLVPLSAAVTEYTSAALRVRRRDPFWRRASPLGAIEGLLRRGSIYATPECRVRLEGRARYNLAFDAAALRAAHPATGGRTAANTP